MGVGDTAWSDARNDTTTGYPADQSITELFRAQVGRAPDAIALSSEGRRVTYAELDRWSDRLGARLAEAGVAAGEPVGLLGEHCLEVPVGMLAVLKAGAVYVPLDQADPVGRLRLPAILKPRSGAASAYTCRPASARWRCGTGSPTSS
jgi:non-ribosomal peptide synthetase component F